MVRGTVNRREAGEKGRVGESKQDTHYCRALAWSGASTKTSRLRG